MTTLGCSHAMGAAESGDEVSVAFDHRCARTCGVSVSARGVSLSARGVSVSARFRSLSLSLGHALLGRLSALRWPAAMSATFCAMRSACEACVVPLLVYLRGWPVGGPSACCAPCCPPPIEGRRSACTSVQLQVPEGATGVRARRP